MFYYKYIKKTVFFYMAITIVFCIVGPTALFLSKYEIKLSETEEKMGVINVKKTMIVQDTKKIEELSSEIIKILPKEQDQLIPKEQILIRLDDFQLNNNNINMKVLDFEESKDVLYLPIILDFPVIDFTKTVTFIGNLQGMKFPHFIINSLSFTSEQNGKVTCAIKGAFVCFNKEKV